MARKRLSEMLTRSIASDGSALQADMAPDEQEQMAMGLERPAAPANPEKDAIRFQADLDTLQDKNLMKDPAQMGPRQPEGYQPSESVLDGKVKEQQASQKKEGLSNVLGRLLERAKNPSKDVEQKKNSGFESLTLDDVKAAGMGAVRGATADFADELYGASQAPIGAAKTALSNITGEDVSENSSVKDYKSSRDYLRNLQKKMEEESPKSTLAGQIGGSVLGVGKVLPASIPGVVAASGISSLGSAEDNLAEETAKGAFSGAAFGKINSVLGKTGPSSKKAVLERLSKSMNNDVNREKLAAEGVKASEPYLQSLAGKDLEQFIAKGEGWKNKVANMPVAEARQTNVDALGKMKSLEEEIMKRPNISAEDKKRVMEGLSKRLREAQVRGIKTE